MTVSGVRFLIVSPMLFRSAGEFSPQARGPLSFARTLVMPLPSTLAGCLASMRGKFAGVAGDWDEAAVKALGLESGFMRGPYLLDGNEIFIGVERKEVTGLLNLEKVEKYVTTLLSGDTKKLPSLVKKVRTTSKLGIGLKSRKEGKIVDRERGLMYLADFVDYPATLQKPYVEIGMDVHGINLGELSNKIGRLGGEGRITKVRTGDPVLWSLVKDVEVKPTASICLLLLTYSLLEDVPLAVGEVGEGSYIFPNLQESLERLINRLTNQSASVESVVGEMTLLGAGYDIRNFGCGGKGRRKPSYVSLKPGSVIKLKVTSQFDLKKLYENGVTSRGGKIGYGTFLPVPV